MPDATNELHEACYVGDVARVRVLLSEGADANAPAAAGGRTWVSSAGDRPRPLNCVALAWCLGDAHVEIAQLLIAHGALVDATVLSDHGAEMVGSRADMALAAVLRDAALVEALQ